MSTLDAIKSLPEKELWLLVWELECVAEQHGCIVVIEPDYFWINAPKGVQ